MSSIADLMKLLPYKKPINTQHAMWYDKYTKIKGLECETKTLTRFLLSDQPSERLFIEGPTGCGKSILVKTLIKEYRINCEVISQRPKSNFVCSAGLLVIEDYDMLNDSNFNDFLSNIDPGQKVCILGHKWPKTLKGYEIIKISQPDHATIVQVLTDVCIREKIPIPDLSRVISLANYDYRYAITLLQSGFYHHKDDRLAAVEKLCILPLLSTKDIFNLTDRFSNLLIHENYLHNDDNIDTALQLAQTFSDVDRLGAIGFDYEGLVGFQQAQIGTNGLFNPSNFSNKTSLLVQNSKKFKSTPVNRLNCCMLSNACHKFIVQKKWTELAEFINYANVGRFWYDIYRIGRIKHVSLTISQRVKVDEFCLELKCN
jgi:energy-coupling factor transporter ATP-binding protein EcfA2